RPPRLLRPQGIGSTQIICLGFLGPSVALHWESAQAHSRADSILKFPRCNRTQATNCPTPLESAQGDASCAAPHDLQLRTAPSSERRSSTQRPPRDPVPHPTTCPLLHPLPHRSFAEPPAFQLCRASPFRPHAWR